MRYFDIPTIKGSIDGLDGVSANWLIPAFVFAANGVGTTDFVDLAKGKGTDKFLDNYFNGNLIGIDPFPTSNNLLRPRLKGLKRVFPDDYVIRQDTKMWGNIFSSRGYREMRLRGEIEGEKAVVRLTDTFQPAFEGQIPESFHFEDFLVWLFAFSGFLDAVNSWQELYDHLVKDVLGLDELDESYRGRFTVGSGVPWPTTLSERPSDETFQEQLAPQLMASLVEPPSPVPVEAPMDADDPILGVVRSAIDKGTGRSFLLAGPPGTGKTHHARNIAEFLAEGDEERMLFLQFHPAFSYDDFVEGFRPAVDDSSDTSTGVKYVLDDRHFLEFAERARSDQEKLYVLVIDELNRGEVARIFGELLTYLELEYRDKTFTLATSGRPMSFPKNLVVLATANPFDRSVTDLDDALLRRFIVILMEPDKAFLERYLTHQGIERRVLTRTLRVFDLLKDAFPTGFGHTNFLKVRTIEDLAEVWLGRVQLGLQRALYHDNQKYEQVKSDIEQLLRIDEEAETAGDDDSGA